MSVQFSKPKIENDSEKPIPIENKGFPYSMLADSRRFEELIFSIYKQEISFGDWKGKYDDINILQGVREKGRDCTLHKEGKTTGVIQCKYSNRNNRISDLFLMFKTDFMLEMNITDLYVLYSHS